MHKPWLDGKSGDNIEIRYLYHLKDSVVSIGADTILSCQAFFVYYLGVVIGLNIKYMIIWFEPCNQLH